MRPKSISPTSPTLIHFKNTSSDQVTESTSKIVSKVKNCNTRSHLVFKVEGAHVIHSTRNKTSLEHPQKPSGGKVAWFISDETLENCNERPKHTLQRDPFGWTNHLQKHVGWDFSNANCCHLKLVTLDNLV
ncbi:hypothetical protein OGATHE_001746 [Ogataea polymorpha]|uniref:Uncharacterized protein n=1 Tax=Ogataea polymorpha TaxID=460523 RepID=A0A9P8TDZ1_9ASCO|nr:hypothetical protein OGATHE_001746 [Ogataea polymorpha]